MKDWAGNKHSMFVTLGASNHTDHERANNDYYATSPIAAELLLHIEPQLDNIWENAVGGGDLAKIFEKHNKLGLATDLVDRGYRPNVKYIYGEDFLMKWNKWNGDIVTNPPYNLAKDFVEHSLELIEENRYVCMFLKLTFLEGKKRKKLFEKYPPIRVWVSSSRISCANSGNFEKYKSSAACYAWFIWQKGYNGDTAIKWFN